MNDDIDDGTGFGDGTDSGDGPGVEEELLEEELRQAASLLDPVPPALLQAAVDAFALRDLEARVAELTFDSLLDALPVRGAAAAPRMLTFSAGEVTLDVELTEEGLIGQVLPRPPPASTSSRPPARPPRSPPTTWAASRPRHHRTAPLPSACTHRRRRS